MVEKTLLDSRNFDLPFQKTGVWTVNDEKDFQHFVELGVFGIITDIPVSYTHLTLPTKVRV